MIAKIAILCVGCSLLVMAEDPGKTNKPPAPTKNVPTVTIPAGAKQVEPYLYRYTDEKGKTWMYRQTPFGVTRFEESAVAQPTQDDAKPVVVKDLGESYQFTMGSPFGERKWTRKKTELTEEERDMVAKAGAPAPPASKTAPSVDAKQEKR